MRLFLAKAIGRGSLRDLQAIRRVQLGPIRSCVVGAMCTGTPTSALVICGYGTEPWAVTCLDGQHPHELVHR